MRDLTGSQCKFLSKNIIKCGLPVTRKRESKASFMSSKLKCTFISVTGMISQLIPQNYLPKSSYSSRGGVKEGEGAQASLLINENKAQSAA